MNKTYNCLEVCNIALQMPNENVTKFKILLQTFLRYIALKLKK